MIVELTFRSPLVLIPQTPASKYALLTIEMPSFWIA
jgi:hypothetical protein